MYRNLTMLLFVLVIGVFTGCSNNRNTKDDTSIIDVYYIDTKSLGLASEQYELIGSEPNEQVDELMYMIKKAPENLTYKSVLPDKLTYSCDYNGDNSLTINFDTTYNELSGISEVLSRAAIVKTLGQLDVIETIQFKVNGSPLIDSNGEIVDSMSVEDFVDNANTNTNYKVKLYFANQEGDALIGYETSINYTGTSSLEELAINKLIEGPKNIAMLSTMPEGTKLLHISKSDGICTVDFNEAFLEKVPDVKPVVTINSIVNTLVELPDINKVQFTIKSKTVETYGDVIDFDGLFERNLNLIKSTE
ncbi:MAG: GerMN domain-containing protein [Mobilitalea sp.]